MRVAVISAYYKEPLAILRRCHDSVLAQQGDVTHFMVADGFPVAEIDRWPGVVHLTLPNHADFGDTPRGIGAASAAANGFDALCFLDADNWYEPSHIATMLLAMQATDAQVITAARTLFTADGRRLSVCTESDGVTFNDTNCYFLARAAFPACAAWLFKDARDSAVGDKLFWNAVCAGGYSRCHSTAPTVNYTSTLAYHYRLFGETPPDDSRVIAQVTGETHYRVFTYAQTQAMGGVPGW